MPYGGRQNHNADQLDGLDSTDFVRAADIATTVGTPGLDTLVPSEQAVREAIDAIPVSDLTGYAKQTTVDVRYVVATDGDDSHAGTAAAISGTAIITGSTSVLGEGTTFTALAVGDYLVIAHETRKIQSITDDHTLTVTAAFSGTSMGNAIYHCSAPLLTLGAAIAKFPTIVNHNLFIYLAPGTYPETVTLRGYAGQGTISLYGATTATNTHTVNNVYALNVAVVLSIFGLQASTNNTHGFFFGGCNYVFLCDGYATATTASFAGISVESGTYISISGGTYSNKSWGVLATSGGTAALRFVGGNNNSTGISATDGGQIRKRNSTVPSGTVAEQYSAGGLIVGSSGAKVGTS